MSRSAGGARFVRVLQPDAGFGARGLTEERLSPTSEAMMPCSRRPACAYARASARSPRRRQARAADADNQACGRGPRNDSLPRSRRSMAAIGCHASDHAVCAALTIAFGTRSLRCPASATATGVPHRAFVAAGVARPLDGESGHPLAVEFAAQVVRRPATRRNGARVETVAAVGSSSVDVLDHAGQGCRNFVDAEASASDRDAALAEFGILRPAAQLMLSEERPHPPPLRSTIAGATVVGRGDRRIDDPNRLPLRGAVIGDARWFTGLWRPG